MRRSVLLVLAFAAGAGAAPREFQVTAQSARELARRAQIRCGGTADRVGELSDAGVQLTGTFTCQRYIGVDVTDALRVAELVVRGEVTKVETPPAAQFGDPAPGWRRATVKIKRVLKGRPDERSASFLFIGSKKDDNAQAPKVRVGQSGVWLLTRGTGPVRELMMLTSLDAHPADAEEFIAELLLESACPAAPSGPCTMDWAVCPGPERTCSCQPPCGGGADIRPDPKDHPARWICRPNACATAAEGKACAPDGIFCEGCWGTSPWACERGKWVLHQIPPPP